MASAHHEIIRINMNQAENSSLSHADLIYVFAVFLLLGHRY